MNVYSSPTLPDVLIIEPKVFRDSRGFFLEHYQEKRYKEHGINLPFVQHNFSHSTRGVLRGFHYQLQNPQGKLVWVTRGSIFDVAVDVRHGSPTFGHTFGIILDDQDHKQVYIPPGFAHGFYAISETVDFHFKCTEYYHAASVIGFHWQDPDLNITWPTTDNLIIDPRDAAYPRLKDIPKEHLPLF